MAAGLSADIDLEIESVEDLIDSARAKLIKLREIKATLRSGNELNAEQAKWITRYFAMK